MDTLESEVFENQSLEEWFSKPDSVKSINKSILEDFIRNIIKVID